jgi:hypothetical protein
MEKKLASVKAVTRPAVRDVLIYISLNSLADLLLYRLADLPLTAGTSPASTLGTLEAMAQIGPR